MKQIIILFTIIYFISCINTEHEDRLGPAYNIEDRGEDNLSCSDYYVVSGSSWLDDLESTDFVPNGPSDCVDLHLWSPQKNKYFDKCCYVRFQLKGKMHAGCVGLSQDNYNDSSETISRMEKGDRVIWTREADGSKIYNLDCGSSFIKYFSLASILLLALFF